ncbi:4'-phosphopantetheinyl transferase superfamily protein [Legionella israelensis]|uniref:4'-phosphopantetheinyl transferase family protein n=1 Tax=Legionella israelensis TaxID=454 RepID=UPI001180F204|nr:4'-phosphopantetheinyl transferase superfamily protein [Legionella israelensis]QDP72387.1 4'-phosphopantetheinyl transferase superfamily protein [Legionella israelensis]
MSKSEFKIFSLSDCVLKNRQIDLWFFSLRHELPKLQALLSPDEIKRANRFYFPRHQRRFRHARGLLRVILSRYLHCHAKDIKFEYNPHGKPEIHHQSDVQFNVSHTGEWAIIAVGKKYPLGVDIEQYSARPYQGIAQHLFSHKEQESLLSMPFFLKPWFFFNVWAQKEAFIKACGVGLFYPTNEFSVISEAGNHQQILDKRSNTRWEMKTFMPKAAVSAAICHHPDIDQIRYLPLENPAYLLSDL